jgi:hypothetical protein
MNGEKSVPPGSVEGLASTSPLGQTPDGPGSVRTGVVGYVKATAALMELPLDDERAERVAGHLLLSAALAKALEAYPLPPEVEPAEVYCPAPFTSSGGGLRWP